jgi:hypothetical protein
MLFYSMSISGLHRLDICGLVQLRQLVVKLV